VAALEEVRKEDSGQHSAHNGYQEHSFSKLFVPKTLCSHDGTFILETIRSMEHSFPRKNQP